eukprot:TRINITY_DN64886_c0_g1_i2.p2 TRINITY_DN64886_c0_g1~~TRINITY_DN64886_c0_g1_i2.p2  ORF type:complete len:398 (-),score=24.55 TRINITY_DN64886_c0_g1_i2:2326-3432(-)
MQQQKPTTHAYLSNEAKQNVCKVFLQKDNPADNLSGRKLCPEWTPATCAADVYKAIQGHQTVVICCHTTKDDELDFIDSVIVDPTQLAVELKACRFLFLSGHTSKGDMLARLQDLLPDTIIIGTESSTQNRVVWCETLESFRMMSFSCDSETPMLHPGIPHEIITFCKELTISLVDTTLLQNDIVQTYMTLNALWNALQQKSPEVHDIVRLEQQFFKEKESGDISDKMQQKKRLVTSLLHLQRYHQLEATNPMEWPKPIQAEYWNLTHDAGNKDPRPSKVYIGSKSRHPFWLAFHAAKPYACGSAAKYAHTHCHRFARLDLKNKRAIAGGTLYAFKEPDHFFSAEEVLANATDRFTGLTVMPRIEKES